MIGVREQWNLGYMLEQREGMPLRGAVCDYTKGLWVYFFEKWKHRHNIYLIIIIIYHFIGNGVSMHYL